MGRNQQNQKPERSYRNIFKSISVGCPIQTIRRMVHGRQSPSPAKHHGESSNPIVKTVDLHNKRLTPPQSASEPVPIHFDYSVPEPKPAHNKLKEKKSDPFGHSAKPNSRGHGQRVEPEAPYRSSQNTTAYGNSRNNSRESNMEDPFAKYINTRMPKLRATSGIGDDDYSASGPAEKAFSRKGTSKDVFADYIKRAQMKIRATSSTGGGSQRTDSFKSWKD